MLVPVTPALRTDLANSGALLATVDPSTLNDLANFGNLVTLLDTLTRSVLTAAASGPIVTDISHAARFNIGPGTALSDVLASSAEYLRGPAATALGGTLSGTTHVLCDQIWTRIVSLFDNIMDAIARVASVDLANIHSMGAAGLIDAADLLAQAAHV